MALWYSGGTHTYGLPASAYVCAEPLLPYGFYTCHILCIHPTFVHMVSTYHIHSMDIMCTYQPRVCANQGVCTNQECVLTRSVC